MGRIRRNYYKQVVYHVYNRGNNKEEILKEGEDKKIFLEIVGKCRERFCFKIYGYALMSNHYHLIIETNELSDISKIMHAMMKTYGNGYRKRRGYVGHLWQSRFKSRIIEDEQYFQECLDYIHQNPVKANIVNVAEEYLWSSAKDYSINNYNNEFLKIDKYGDT